jgi:hypothetical protein
MMITECQHDGIKSPRKTGMVDDVAVAAAVEELGRPSWWSHIFMLYLFLNFTNMLPLM